MLNSMYYKETFLIAIVLITTTIADDYHSNEEVTSTSLDFFDAENNNEFFDPRRQSTLRNIFSSSSSRINNNNRGLHNVMPEPESSGPSVGITTNSIPTTMVPGFDPVQTISSFTQQLDDEDISNYTTTSSAFNEVAQDHYIFTNISEPEYAEDQDDVIITTSSAVTRMKQGKQIPISNLQPHEALRKFVEDSYIRRPLAILIDTAQDHLNEIKRLWMDALRPNAPLDCVLLAYNASGVPIIYNFTKIRTLLAGINSIVESENSRGNGFFGIIRAIELIPYDSAVFVSTGMLPIDENLAQYAATSLLKKRIRLYLTWLGEKSQTENETHQEAGGILGSVAVRSGGEVIYAGDMKLGDNPTDNMVTIFSDHLQGTQEQELTIEPTVSDLHIKVDTVLKSISLETPNGEINLLKAMRTQKFNSADVMEAKVNRANDSDIQPDNEHQQMTSHDPKSNRKQHQFIRSSVRLAKPLSHPTKFYLKLQPENSKDKYRVIVSARNGYNPAFGWSESMETDDLLSKRTFEMFNLPDNKVDFKRENHPLSTRNLLQLTHENLRFPTESDNGMGSVDDIIEVDKNINENATAGRQEQQVTNLQNFGTMIEMGVQSQLLLAPGSIGQLYFEITNYRAEPIFYTFQVTGEQQFLVSLNTPSLLFAPGQTAVAIVTVRIPPTTSVGTKDQITFTCQGNGQVSKMALLRVVQTTDNQDGVQPSLHWYYGSRCDGNKLETGVCADAIWSVDVTAHDWGAGLLRIQSNPRGIYTRNSYTSGTTSPVTAVYSSSCCQPKVTVTAYDLAGNARTATIDVRDFYLSEASIAAIVLGAILLILIIIALIILIVWCCKRRRETIDLPTYRTHRRVSPSS